MQLNEHHLLKQQLFRLKHTELNEIYTVQSLRAFFFSLVFIFIPIYLYRIGFSLNEIFLYYTFFYAFEASLEYLSTHFLVKLGPKHCIIFSLPISALSLVALWTIPSYHWPLYLVAFLNALGMAFYWQGYHYDFSKVKHADRTTQEISRLYIALAILGAIAPLLGGLIAEYLGMGLLYIIVTLGLLAAIFPLFKSHEPHRRTFIDLSKVKIKKIFMDQISYASYGIEGAASVVLWPLFVFFIVGSYKNVGLVTTAALILTLSITYIVGKKADKMVKTRFIKTGSFLTGLTYFLKAAADSISHVFVLNILTSITHSLFSASWVAEYYLHADEEGRAEYILLMEIAVDLGRVAYFLMLYFISYYLSIKVVLVLGLVFGGMFSFLIGLMPPAEKEMKLAENFSPVPS